MKTKTFFVRFSNACSILELMLCMRSKIELAFEKSTKFPIKIRLKRTIIRQQKMTINQCKKNFMRNSFCKNVLLCTINTISMVLEMIIIKFSCILKTMFRNTIPEPQPDSASYTIYRIYKIYKIYTLYTLYTLYIINMSLELSVSEWGSEWVSEICTTRDAHLKRWHLKIHNSLRREWKRWITSQTIYGTIGIVG